MKKYIGMLVALGYAIFVLTGCAALNTDDATSVGDKLFYGEVELPDDLFSIKALYNNSLVYLTNNDAGMGVSVFDVSTGKAIAVCRLEDHLMSPANCAFLDGTLYFNYMSNDGLRKMIAVDIQHTTAETVIAEEGINGLVYSVPYGGNIFSLKHNGDGLSIIECYVSQDGTAIVFLSTNEPIHAISSFGGQLYIILSDKNGKYFVRQYDGKGDIAKIFEIPYASGILKDSQVGHFQMMENALYLINFSSQSGLFSLDGVSLESAEDWSIATESFGESPQYVFFLRGSDKELIICEEGMDEFREYELDIQEDYVIRFVYSDLNNPQRVMVSLRNTETGDEIVSVVDTNS